MNNLFFPRLIENYKVMPMLPDDLIIFLHLNYRQVLTIVFTCENLKNWIEDLRKIKITQIVTMKDKQNERWIGNIWEKIEPTYSFYDHVNNYNYNYYVYFCIS